MPGAVRDHDDLHPQRVEFVDAEVIVDVGQHLREALRIAEVAVVEAGDVGVLLQLGQIELAGCGGKLRRGQRRARHRQRSEKSAPAGRGHGSHLPCSFDYLLTGLSGLITSATRSLIWSMVSTLLAAEPRHVRARKSRLRIVDLFVHRLGLGLAELADLAVVEQARPDRAVADLGLGQLVAGVAVAAVRPARRIVGEAQAVARLRDLLARLPVAHQLAVGRILDPRLLALLDRLGDRLRRHVLVQRALLHRLVLHEARLPVGRRGRERLVDRGIGRAGIGARYLLGGRRRSCRRAGWRRWRLQIFRMVPSRPLSASARGRRSRRPRRSSRDRR